MEIFIPYVIGDMEYNSELVQKEKLNVFTFEQIIGYIETSVDLGLQKLTELWEYSKGF